jgi:hypothetical protein
MVKEGADHLAKPVRRIPENFDPRSIRIINNAPVPPVHKARRNTCREVIAQLAPTQSTVLANAIADSVVAQMKKDGVRYCVRSVSPTAKQLWREPSPEQLKGILNV